MLTIATHNLHKLQEISEILSPISCQGIQELKLSPPEETGLTFVENAIIKARYISNLVKTPCLADDSGLVVPALQGRPGIYSARYAGIHATDEENRLELLKDMKNLQDEQRYAYFYCVMVLLTHANDPTPIISVGQWHGYIIEKSRGVGGFGYDPIFFLPGLQKTAAELDAIDKNRLSHRGMALNELKPHLQDLI